MTARLAGKVAIITGGGRGIGAAIARGFAAEGASLAIASRTAAQLEQVAAACREAGTDCLTRATDVSLPAEVDAFVAAARAHFGRIDILVNAAGVYGPIGTITQIDLSAWRDALQVNLIGTVTACRAALPSMMERRSGSIINFSGGGAAAPLPRFSAYGVSKAAVVRFTDTLAEEVAEYGIRVNAIAPGAVDTKLQDDVLKAGSSLAGELYGRIRALRESGKGGTPVELPAQLAVFLASDDSLGLSGRLISAPHDPWREWDRSRIEALRTTPWYTLRRIDPFTINPIKDQSP